MYKPNLRHSECLKSWFVELLELTSRPRYRILSAMFWYLMLRLFFPRRVTTLVIAVNQCRSVATNSCLRSRRASDLDAWAGATSPHAYGNRPHLKATGQESPDVRLCAPR